MALEFPSQLQPLNGGGDYWSLIRGKDIDITEGASALTSLASSDIFLVDDNAAGVQSSTKYITASDIASYIQVGAPLDKGNIIVGNASNISSILDAGDPGQVLKIDTDGTIIWSSSGGGGDVVDDTTPQLGGDLDLDGYSLIHNAGDGYKDILSIAGNKVYAGGHGRADIYWQFRNRDGTNHGILFNSGGDNDGNAVGNAGITLTPRANNDYWGGVLRIAGQGLSIGGTSNYPEQGTGTIEFTRGNGASYEEAQPSEKSAWIKAFTSKYNLDLEGDSSGTNFTNYTTLSASNYASSLAFGTTSVGDVVPTEKFRIQPDGSLSLYTLRSGTLNLTTNSDSSKDHYLKCGDIVELSGVQNFTISTWVYRTGTDDEYVIWSKELDDNNYLELTTYDGNDFQVNWKGTSHQGASAESGSTTTVLLQWDLVGNDVSPVVANTWTHIVIVYDGSQGTASNRIKGYWNGAPQTPNGTSGTIPVKTPNLSGGTSPASDFNIGGDAKTDGRYFIGYIGETAIWNSSLTASQIDRLYDNGYPLDATIIKKDNLVAYWKMNELDSSGNVINFINSGTYDGDPTGDSDTPALSTTIGKQSSIFETSTTGINVYRNKLNINNNYISESEGILLKNKQGGISIDSDGNTSFLGESKAIEFNDIVGDAEGTTRFIDCGNISALNSLATFTVSIWVYHSMKAAQTIWGLSEDSGSDLNKMSLEVASDNVISVHLDAANSVLRGVDDGSNHTQNEWINYTVIYNGGESTDANELKLYKNGTQITFSSIGSIPDTTPNFGSESFYIGKVASGSNDEWQGKIGETAIWNTNLTAAEALTLYDNGHPYQANAMQPDYLLAYWKMDGTGGNATYNNTDDVTVYNRAKNYLGLYDATVQGTGAYKFITGLSSSISKSSSSGIDILRGDFNFYGGEHNLQDVEQVQTYSMASTTNTTTTLNSLSLTQKGITASGQTANNNGLSVNINSATPTMVGTVNNIGAEITVTGGTSGTQNNTALSLKATGADTNTHIKCLYDDTNYMTIATGANGATTLTTVDASSGTAANLDLNVSGTTTLDSDIDIFVYAERDIAIGESGNDGRTLSINMDNFQVNTGNIKIKEHANAQADTAAYGQIWVRTVTPNELWFTNDAGNDVQITTGTVLATPDQYIYMHHQWYTTSSSNVYIPFAASTVDSTFTSDSLIDDQVWIAMFAGALVEAKLYTDEDCGNTDLRLNINGTLQSSLLSGGAVNCSSDKTVYTFTCDQNNTFSAGDVVRIYHAPTNAGKYCTLSTKWKIS